MGFLNRPQTNYDQRKSARLVVVLARDQADRRGNWAWLSISFEIVTQQHGGTITVDSEVGDFTDFTVGLPRRGRALADGVIE